MAYVEPMPDHRQTKDVIRVKLLSREPARILSRQLPGNDFVWGNCRFLFDPQEREYDWLVVYNDLPHRRGENDSLQEEILACPRRHTLLVTTEPSSIKAYGARYTAQFGCVLTSQEAWALPHPDRIHSQPALHWFYGVSRDHVVSCDELSAMDHPEKTADISMVWSGKKGYFTQHSKRHAFMQRVREVLPGLEVYGRGVRELDDKAEALNSYRYHIAIENHIGLHHWTEKLADPFLAYSLPFYSGCPNIREYFPPESIIPIDIEDVEGAVAIIKRAIKSREYEKRLSSIREARRRVLEEYNLFAVLAREIGRRNIAMDADVGGVLYSRHALVKKFPLAGLRLLFEKAGSKVKSLMMQERK
jgi:hypothetical protein